MSEISTKDLYDYLLEHVPTKTDLKESFDVFRIEFDGKLSEMRDGIRLEIRDKMSELRESIISVVATKSDIQEVKQLIQRLSTRTDEDIRAVIKDVAILKEKIT